MLHVCDRPAVSMLDWRLVEVQISVNTDVSTEIVAPPAPHNPLSCIEYTLVVRCRREDAMTRMRTYLPLLWYAEATRLWKLKSLTLHIH